MLPSFERSQRLPAGELQDNAREVLIEKLRKERDQERELHHVAERESRFQKGIIFMMQQIIVAREQDITERDEALAAKERELNTDEKTGAASERGLQKFIEERRSSEEEHDMIILFFDIDRFKQVNDTYGHDVGDDALRAVAEYLKERFSRKNDLVVQMVQTGGDYASEVARPHGDEFIVICTNADQEKIMEMLRREETAVSISHQGKTIPIQLSVGATTYIPGETLKDAKQRADANMYEMKRAHHAGEEVDGDREQEKVM